MTNTCHVAVLGEHGGAIKSFLRAAMVLPWYSSATPTLLSNSETPQAPPYRGGNDMSDTKISTQK